MSGVDSEELNEKEDLLQKKMDKLERKMKNLTTWYNPDPGGISTSVQESGFYSAVDSGHLELKTFEQEWNHPDLDVRKKWHAAIKKEISDVTKRKVWTFKTKLDDILAYKRGTPKDFSDFDLQKVGDNLHRFGEISIATKTKKLKGKLEDRGDTSYFVGYADHHAADVFRMVNIRTNKVSETRDVTFTGKMYGEIFDAEN